ncbi:MAG: hypothetical protein ACREBA_05880 [Nitrosotalea sp.]
MPDESCRTCGGELTNHTLCFCCRKSIQKKCKMCNHVTLLQPHQYCIKKPLLQQKPLLVQEVVSKKTVLSRNYLRLSFLAVTVVGFLVLGLVSASDHGISPSIMPNDAQATNSSEIAHISSNFPVEYGKSYDNCLAYGSGESITVTCPTNDGSVYKGILNVPQDLKKDFSDSVFSIRGVTVTENPDGSVLLQYQMKKYLTNYFGN